MWSYIYTNQKEGAYFYDRGVPVKTKTGSKYIFNKIIRERNYCLNNINLNIEVKSFPYIVHIEADRKQHNYYAITQQYLLILMKFNQRDTVQGILEISNTKSKY